MQADDPNKIPADNGSYMGTIPPSAPSPSMPNPSTSTLPPTPNQGMPQSNHQRNDRVIYLIVVLAFVIVVLVAFGISRFVITKINKVVEDSEQLEQDGTFSDYGDNGQSGVISGDSSDTIEKPDVGSAQREPVWLEAVNAEGRSYKKILEGGWLSDDSSCYYEFRGNHYRYYRDYHNLKDDYWEGTFSVVVGEQGLIDFGLNVDGMRQGIVNSGGTLTEDDYIAITLKPELIFTGGKDMTKTNMKPGLTLRHLWILDQAKDSYPVGSQTLDVQRFDTFFYNKVED